MGRSYTPTYRVEYNDNPFRVAWNGIEAWDCKRYGRPTAKNLTEWRNRRNASMQKGGVNDHIPAALGYIPHISHAKIVRQSTGEVVAEYVMPAFEIAA